jgi:hypothetical protein
MTRTAFTVAAAVCLCTQIAGAQSGSLRVIVSGAESRLPLAYSAGTAADGPGRLTDDSGRVELRDLPSGPLRILVRHVGYLPAERTVMVVGRTITTVDVVLERAAITLDAVRVDADRPCVDPGPSAAAADSLLATAFVQLEQNARQYRLITREYPFIAFFRQHYTRLTSVGVEDLRARITPVRSKDEWRYKPGEVVVQTAGGGYGVNIPTLSVFADSTFLMTHCFRSAGVDSSRGGATLRVDFEPDVRLTHPDLAGSIYLDPRTFVIRRSVIRLTGDARETAQFDSIIVMTRFEELLPAIPVPTVAAGRDYYAGSPMNRTGAREIALREDQRLTELRFEKRDPAVPDNVAKHGRNAAPMHRLDRILGVFDASTGEPIPGALVTDTTDDIAMRTTATGTLSMAYVGDDETGVRIEKPGYEPQTVHVALVLGPSTPITIALQPIKRP